MQYFKITNQKEIHNGYAYHDGLNILEEEFNADPNDSCVAGGFYFTTLKYISLFLDYGVNLREVFLPTNDPNFKMVMDPDGNKWRANMIILGYKYSLFDPETYTKFGLDITKDSDIDCSAVKYGNINFLEWYRTCYAVSKFFINDALDDASSHNRIEMLYYLRKTYPDILNYSGAAMDKASKRGYIAVLEWWKNSGLELTYSEYAMDYASANGHVEVLDWWKNSGLELKYSIDALSFASINGHTKVLDWWKNSGLKMLYSEYVMDYSDNTYVLDWWKNSGLELKYSKDALYHAFSFRYPDLLYWWKNSGLEIEFDADIPQRLPEDIKQWLNSMGNTRRKSCKINIRELRFWRIITCSAISAIIVSYLIMVLFSKN